MKNIGIWLYRYIAIHVDHMLHDVLSMLDAMMSDPVSRPAFQRVKTSVSPNLSDIRLRSNFLTPWI